MCLTLDDMTDEKIIQTATFNSKVCTYWLLSGIIVLTCTIVGIPLILLWVPLGLYFTGRYLESV